MFFFPLVYFNDYSRKNKQSQSSNFSFPVAVNVINKLTIVFYSAMRFALNSVCRYEIATIKLQLNQEEK